MVADTIQWRADWRVRRFSEHATRELAELLGREPVAADFERYDIAPYGESLVEQNLLTTAGLNRLGNLIIASGGPQGMTNTATRIGVGNGVGTAAAGDTDLSAAAGSTNRFFQTMDASFPTQSNGVFTLQATFASANGNFTWNEFGIDIGTPTVTTGTTVNALLLNHKTSIAQGTKASGQTWVATATLTLS